MLKTDSDLEQNFLEDDLKKEDQGPLPYLLTNTTNVRPEHYKEHTLDSVADVIAKKNSDLPFSKDSALAAIAGALTKRQLASKKAKAEKIVDKFSVPSKTAAEAVEELATSGSKKSAEKSAQIIEEAIKRAQMASSKTPLLERVGALASKLPVRGVIGAGLGAAAALPGLYGDEGNAPEPSDPYLNPYRAGVKEMPSGLKSEQPAPFSSKEPQSDTADKIVADALATKPARSPLGDRPEYKQLVEKYKELPEFKNMSAAYANRSGGYAQSASEAENLAAKTLKEYDELSALPPEKKSELDNIMLARLQAKIYPSADYTAPSSLKSENKIPGTELMERQRSSPLNAVDTEGAILSDALKSSAPASGETEAARMLADLESAPASVKAKAVPAAAPAKSAVGPTQPTSKEVARQDREDELTKVIGKEEARKVSEYEDLMRRYQETQDRANQMRMMAGIGEGAELLGASIAGVKPADASFYRQMAEQADLLPKQFKETEDFKKEARRNDPNSEESESARALLKEQGITVPKTVSAAFIEKQYPQFANILARREAAKERAESRKERAEERAFAREQLLSDKDAKDFTKLSEKLTAELASSRSAFGKGANIIRSAEAIETLVSQMNPRDINTRQIQELARGLDAMLSQGAATISGTKKLVPESYSADFAKIAEYITSKPKGAGQEAFVKQMMETVEREKETAKRQMRQTQNKILSGYEHLKERYPERYKRMLQEFGADAELPPSGEQKEKVVVEKDGKKYRLPKEQLQRALSQGYKEVQ